MSVVNFDWSEPYHPEKATNQQLADDWRLFIAAIANLDAGKDEPFNYTAIYSLASMCLREIAKRVKKGEMQFSIAEEKSPAYHKLWQKVSQMIEPEALSVLLDSPPLPDLAPVNPSGNELGEEITLSETLPYFKSFYRTKPYISLVGGLCTQGKTRGDIDIFINSTFRDLVTEFRIIRMFPSQYWFRLQFHYPSETHPGKFTNYIDLFHEFIEVVKEPQLVLMSAPKELEMFKFAPLLKPMHGRFKGEVYEIDKLIEIVNARPEWYESKIAVQRKFDGIHCRIDHAKDGKVCIFTEEGNEITSKLPTITSEIKEICKDHDTVFTGELESWEDGKHNPRQMTTAIVHSKGVHPKESSLKLNIFDCLYYN